ncbi:hypothetical protein KVR01_007185 [Diaporthe batatas]|uniref:uncharacterized protein n=1 Tax=Diaporthe batatas TaxID=748121 RepID=UPI001D046C19|nr:uncharacterized protein KVR01_007185 [Diaporthe batatas]KAG8162707.1 hypothetical protein KVR01_007185 [Diaporthe batatas]
MSALKSWIEIPKGSHFSLRNIPFGIISSSKNQLRRPAVAIGSSVVDLDEFAKGGGFAELPEIKSHLHVFGEETLNNFAALGRRVTNAVRLYLQDVLAADTKRAGLLRDNADLRGRAVLPQSDVTMHMPMRIGDYTDFYAGLRHAFTVGTILRGADKALQPNYKHMPVAYHGRASSIVVSGQPIRRPRGQIPAPGSTTPSFAPCRRLDIELEIAALVGRPSEMGTPVSVGEAPDYVFGYVLMNDWSARDIQAWEYIPLGPFTAKNFGTTISPWVVLADAMEPHQAPALPNENTPLPYLVEERKDNVLDIQLEVELETAAGSKTTLTKTSSSNLLWSFPQMIAHHTITGCNLSVGDLLGSGTISGTEKGTQGSMLEATDGGKNPIQLPGSSETRIFLEDGDTIAITGRAGDEENGYVGFGECRGTILPALS